MRLRRMAVPHAVEPGAAEGPEDPRAYLPLQREDRVLDVPEMLHHRYPEVVAFPAARCEPEVDDGLPGEREEDQHRDGAGEEAGTKKEKLTAGKRGRVICQSSPSVSSPLSPSSSHSSSSSSSILITYPAMARMSGTPTGTESPAGPWRRGPYWRIQERR